MKKLLIFLLLLPLILTAQFKVPERVANSYVSDYDHILRPTFVDSLNRKLLSFKEQSSIQFAVVILSDLQGYEIEDASLAIARKWGIGTKELNNGILYLVSPNNHKSRIEVGKGLEGDLTDYQSEEIQEIQKPFYRTGNYEGGIWVVVDSTINTLKPISWQQRMAYRTEKERLEKIHHEEMVDTFWTLLRWVVVFLILGFGFLWYLYAKQKEKEAKDKEAQAKKEAEMLERKRVESYKELPLLLKDKVLELKKRKEIADNYVNQCHLFGLDGEEIKKTLDAEKNEADIQCAQIDLLGQDASLDDIIECKNRIARIGRGYKDAVAKLVSDVTHISQMQAIVVQFQKNAPILRKRAEKNLPNTPFTDLKDKEYNTIMGTKKYFQNRYDLVIMLQTYYNDIINYQKIQEEKQIAAQKREERKKQEEEKKKEESYTPRCIVSFDSYKSNDSSNDNTSNDNTPSDTTFGGGDFGGGGSTSTW